MRDYTFQLIKNGVLVGEGFGMGHSAIEAFENAVYTGGAYLPLNEEVVVIATNMHGLAIKFKANKIS